MTKPSTNAPDVAVNRNSRPILDALMQGTTVLVPNARAAELVRERFSLQMMRDGRKAWPSARILPWRVWLSNYYSRTQVEAPTLLSAEQSLLLWEQVVSEEREFSIQQVSQFTRLAADAWANAHLWQIPLAKLAQKMPSFEVGLFAKWQQKFRQRCHEQQMTDSYLAASELLEKWQRHAAGGEAHHPDSSQQLLVGYAEPPGLLKALAPYCWQWQPSVPAEPEDPGPHLVKEPALQAYENTTEEMLAAIAWAVDQKQENPASAVAIAVSNPNLMGSAVKDGLRRFLHQSEHAERRDLASHIGLHEQQALHQVKLVASALRLLKLGEQLSCDEASAMLLDPYLGNWADEYAARAVVDRDIRNQVRDLSLGTSYLISLVGREGYGLDALHAQFEQLMALREAAAHQQTLIAWQQQFEQELTIMAWPANSELMPEERAAKDAWQQALDGFVSLSPFTGLCTRRHALHRLQSVVQQRLFNKPLTANCIRVVAFEEVSLLEPDAVAWCGLGQHEWPRQAAINPLLPYAAQVQAGVPGTNPSAEARVAQQDFLQQLSFANTQRCSYTRLVEEVENTPALAFATVNAPAPQVPPEVNIQFEEIEDAYGLALASEVSLRNAVRFFADQAACPFRAYAVHRLGSESPEAPALGLDARRRGELVHLAIAKLWQALESQETLALQTAEQLDQLISRIVTETVNEYRRESRQLAQYWTHETQRLIKLLKEWLRVEQERKAFHVVDTEKSLGAEIAAFRFRVRVDRIDRLEDGSLAVIDFKTGKEAASSWLPPRIEQPQLPIYAVNLGEENIAAVAYAQLRNGECKLVENPKGALSKGKRDDDWQAHLDAWRSDLFNTAEQMANGLAVVDPKTKNTCRYCQQRLVCRIGDALDDEPADDGFDAS